MNKFSKYTVIEYQKRVVRFTAFHIKVGEWKIKPKNTMIRLG